MMQLLGNSQGRNNNGAECFNGRNKNHAKGSNTRIPAQNNTRTGNRVTPRPLLPQLLEQRRFGIQGKLGQVEAFNDYLREYHTLGEKFKEAMSLQDLCAIKLRNRPRDFNRGQKNLDLQWKVQKLSTPSFDGSNKCTARAWVQKLDTYFQLNPMRGRSNQICYTAPRWRGS